MRISFALFQVLLFYFGFIPQSLSQTGDSIIARLSLSKTEIEANKAFFITIRIESKQKRIIELPKGAILGYAPEGPCFFSLQVQKKMDGHYRYLKWNTRVDVPLSVDIDTLHFNDFRDYTLPIDMFFLYSKGDYRVRALCFFSSINDTRDVYTNWAYFYSTQEIGSQ